MPRKGTARIILGLKPGESLNTVRVYRIWKQMRQRCAKPSNDAYDRYGGRGIKIDPRWRSFEKFLADMGSPPSDEHSLDRRDNDGPYRKGNCHWATREEQMRNTRRNVLVDVRGRRMPLIEACKLLRLDYRRVHKRLTAYGWSVAEALNLSTRQHPRRKS